MPADEASAKTIGFRVVVTDLETGESETRVMAPGDYCITVTEPCYVANIQTYSNGTVVFTLRNHMGKAPAPTEKGKRRHD